MAFVVNPSQLETRQLQCQITLQSGTFDNGYNSLIANDNTINAVVNKTLNNNFTNSADIIIYGMNKSDIAALSTLGYAPLKYELNKIVLNAQYAGGLPSICFNGFIVRAWCDFADPSRPMHFQCQTSYQDAVDNTIPINASGTTSVPQLFSNLATGLGVSLQNNGVTGIINNAIFTGSIIDQLKTLSKQTSTNCVIDNGVMSIAPKGYSLSNTILNINSASGLLSYPTIDAWGVKFKMRYNPVLQIGQYIALQTIVEIPKSTGQWYVYDMQSSLNNRHENWYTDVRCAYNNVDIG